MSSSHYIGREEPILGVGRMTPIGRKGLRRQTAEIVRAIAGLMVLASCGLLALHPLLGLLAVWALLMALGGGVKVATRAKDRRSARRTAERAAARAWARRKAASTSEQAFSTTEGE